MSRRWIFPIFLDLETENPKKLMFSHIKVKVLGYNVLGRQLIQRTDRDSSEETMLREFLTWLHKKASQRKVVLKGWHISDFDIPILCLKGVNVCGWSMSGIYELFYQNVFQRLDFSPIFGKTFREVCEQYGFEKPITFDFSVWNEETYTKAIERQKQEFEIFSKLDEINDRRNEK